MSEEHEVEARQSGARPPQPHAGRAILLYDAECGVCRFTTGILIAWDRRLRLAPVALQDPEADALLADLAPEERLASWHLVTPGGRRSSGGAGFEVVFGLLPGGAAFARLATRFPGGAARLYEAVARHRGKLGKVVPRALRGWADRKIDDRARMLRHGRA